MSSAGTVQSGLCGDREAKGDEESKKLVSIGIGVQTDRGGRGAA